MKECPCEIPNCEGCSHIEQCGGCFYEEEREPETCLEGYTEDDECQADQRLGVSRRIVLAKSRAKRREKEITKEFSSLGIGTCQCCSQPIFHSVESHLEGKHNCKDCMDRPDIIINAFNTARSVTVEKSSYCPYPDIVKKMLGG